MAKEKRQTLAGKVLQHTMRYWTQETGCSQKEILEQARLAYEDGAVDPATWSTAQNGNGKINFAAFLACALATNLGWEGLRYALDMIQAEAMREAEDRRREREEATQQAEDARSLESAIEALRRLKSTLSEEELEKIKGALG